MRLILIWLIAPSFSLLGMEGVSVISFFGYDDCIRLENDVCEVILCPAAGGRVLVYSRRGENALFFHEEQRGYRYDPEEDNREFLAGGRFDIGPEKIVPSRGELFFGEWKGEITGDRSARMTSVKHAATGVQLVRDFALDETETRLICSQTMINVSEEETNWCYWSRTLGVGGGICVIPLTDPSKYPNDYVMYGPEDTIMFQPEDEHIYRRDDFLIVDGAPKYPKLGMDSYAGWFGYVTPSNLLFLKKYPTYPERNYNEIAGLTISIWYVENWRDWLSTCELEPIGPKETLQPGEQATFTEEWWLIPYDFPENSRDLDLEKVQRVAEKAFQL